jgi:hypothetical protein
MATQNVNIGINVSDNGTTKKVVKNFQEITQAATQAQQAAQGIKTPQGGTGGSRMVAARSAPRGSERLMDNEAYGSARGTAGLTGASARDFANQAQGLGGLVRLYATLAANIFAASAAYTALSNAMDTTNLVKGLDMLGATAGRNLGTLSKRLVEVTDGAVSMRDAMTATAQASSSGMTNKNIERLALVAKNASLALGVAMPDALSRLSRGIVKLEPELLDELGLFTKIGPATERYALEVGKSVSALTDFERRQAFANAILEEGERKFGALSEAASNPYDKLLATLKNVLQSGGELINKVLAPIVSLLAESPTALGAVIAGLGVLLLKQAVPAIGEMRAGLRNTAEEALETAKAFKESFGDEFQTRLEQRFKLPSLEADVKKAEAELAKLKFPGKMPTSVTSLLDEKGELNQKKINSLLETRNNIVATGMRGSKKASQVQIEAAKQEIAFIQKAIDLYTKKQALEAGREGAQALADVTPGRFDAETIAAKKYEDLLSRVDRSNAISNAAQNAQIMGVRGSWALLNAEVAEKGITGFARYSTLAQGGLAAIGSRVMGLISAFSGIAQAVALAVAGFQLLDGWLTKNAKQVENFNKALATADDSVSNITRTLAAATSTEGFATRTIDNTVAFSNALNELTSSASEVIKLSREADRAAGAWDNFWDSVFSVVDRDRASKLAKTVADQLKASVKLLQREGLAEEYNSEIRKILNVDSLEDTKKVAEAFKNLSKTQQDAILLLQNNANRALGNVSSNLQSFKTSLEAALRAQKTLANSFIDSSPMFLYGQNLITVSQGLTKIIAAGPDRVVQALQEVATNTERMGLFGKTFVESFAGISNLFLQQTRNIEASRNALVEYQKTLEQVSKPAKTANLPFGSMNIGVQANDTRQQASIASSDVREIQRAINAQQDGVVRQAITLAKDAAKAIFEEGLLYINKAIREAQNAAAITIGRALTVNLTGVQKIEADNRLRQQEISYQLASIDVSEKVLDVQASLVNEMRLANALQSEANILLKNRGNESAEAKAQNEEATRQVNMARGRLGDTSGLSAIDAADIARERQIDRDLRRKATQAQRIALRAQSQASTIGVQAQRPSAEIAQEEELAKIADRRNASLLSRVQILNSITGITNTELIKARQATEISQLENRQKRELDEIQARITAATDLKLTAEKQNNEQGRAAAKDQQRQIDQLGKIREATLAAQAADTSLIRAKNRQELLSDEIALIGRRAELERSGAELQNILRSTALETQSQELALYNSAYDVSRQVVINQQADLDIRKSQLETSTAIAQAEAILTQKRQEAQANLNALGEGETERAKQINDELARQVSITENNIAGLRAQGAAKVSILQKTREINLEQERYNLLLTHSESLASSLGEIFGELGTSLGNVTKAFTEMAISSEKRAKAEELALNARINAQSTGNEEEILSTEKALEATRKKNAREALLDDIKIVNSTKRVFKEKTAAYKVLDKVEKVMHITKLAMDAKELAVKLSTLAIGTAAKAGAEAKSTSLTFAGTLARLPAYAAEIYGKTIGQLGPIAGPAVAAALVAAMFSMFGKGGGGGGAFVPNAEQRQETQGTAMGWNAQGQKVQVRRGVFGDTDAKSESIANSLEVIKNNSVEGLSYDNRMLRALENLNKALITASESLFGVRGLRSGTLAGVTEGTRTSGIRGLGGRTISQEVIDSGIQLKGTFAELVSASGGVINSYNTLRTTVSRSGFLGFGGGSRSSAETIFSDLAAANPRAAKAIREAFAYAEESLFQVSELAGVADSVVMEAMRNVPIDELISLRGLSGTEFNEALSAVIGSVLDDTAVAIFSSFETFAKFGEGMLETVIRVVDTNTKINQQIRNIGIDSGKLEFAITESLAGLAGGLEDFLDQTNFFRENFLTEAERLLPVQQAVSEEMGRLASLGVTAADGLVDTREEFKLLVQGLDLTTESGKNSFQALMQVADGFDKVTTAAESLNSARQSLLNQILELTSTPSEILANTRAKTLAETPEELRALQNYVFALEDVKTAEENLTKARETEVNRLKQQKSTTESTVNSLKNYINSLQKFRQSLLLGAASPLTPAERYTESKRQFDAILATAMGTAATPAEQRAKDLALSQLEGASSSFLEASRMFNASSPQYTNDFNLVQRALLDTESSLTAQLSVEEKSLAELEKQTGLLEGQIAALDSVSNSVLSLADAIAQLDLAKAAADIAKEVTTEATTKGKIVGGNLYGLEGRATTVSQAKTALMDMATSVQKGSMSARSLYDIIVKQWGADSSMVAQIIGSTQQEVLDWFKQQDPSLPAFARGTNFVPDDMVAQVHQGERIIPAADNLELMQSMSNRNRTNEVLVTEIKKLNQKIESLERVVAEGAVINAEATNRNTEEISRTVKDTGSTASYSEALRRRTQIV